MCVYVSMCVCMCMCVVSSESDWSESVSQLPGLHPGSGRSHGVQGSQGYTTHPFQQAGMA